MKKILAILLLIVINLGVSSQKTQPNYFHISGKIKDYESGIIRIKYVNSDGIFQSDSTKIERGQFTFTGKISEPTIAWLSGPIQSNSVDDPNFTEIFIEPRSLTISLRLNDFKNARVSGSYSQHQLIQLNQQRKYALKKMEGLKDAISKTKNNFVKIGYQNKIQYWGRKLRGMDLNFIQDHPDSYVSIYLIDNYDYVNVLPYSEAYALYNKLSPVVRDSRIGKKILQELNKIKKSLVGEHAIDFRTFTLSGDTISLSQFIGKKIVLLDFWASWCIPCRKENPFLRMLYSAYREKGLEIISVADDDMQESKWKAAIKQDSIELWKHVKRGLKFEKGSFIRDNDINDIYSISELPTLILIDKNGKIRNRYTANDNIEKLLPEAIKKLINDWQAN